MKSGRRLEALGIMMCGLLIVSLMTSGCEPLCKKFTRQRKKDVGEVNAFIPVLEPEEYPEKVYSVTTDYKYRYSLWQVWQRELMTGISEKQSPKRKLYMLDQAIIQVDALKKLLNEEKQPGLEGVLKDLGNLRETLSQPAPMQDDFVILSKLKNIDRNIRDSYSFDKIEASLINQ